MRVRKLWAPLLILIAIGLIATAVFLRRLAPPEPARLLPDADAVAYINAGLIRRFTPVPQRPIQREPEYEEFIQATGFEFERDLEQAALAVHLPKTPHGRARFSHIIVGRFDRDRALAYLKRIATAVERHDDTDIYSIPREDRTLRVAIISADMVALSNTDDPATVRGIIDRYHKAATPFAGPQLLRQHYRHVPFAAPVWAIAQVPRAQTDELRVELDPVVMIQQFAGGSALVLSLRYVGNIELRAQAFTPEEREAQRIAEKLVRFLELYRTYEGLVQPKGADPDVKAFVDSIQVQHDDTTATMTATIPEGFLRKALNPPPPEAAPSPAPETPKPAPQRGPAKQ